MIDTILKGGSLRSWVAFGMALAILPLAIASVGGYVWLHDGVLMRLRDVSYRQRVEIAPVQRLRLMILEAGTPLDSFIDEGHAHLPVRYHAIEDRIDATFDSLDVNLTSDSTMRPIVDAAERQWHAADRAAEEALSTSYRPGDVRAAALMDAFHVQADSAVMSLGLANDTLAKDLREDHDEVLQDVDRSRWVAAIAAFISFLAAVAGASMIGRVMSGSVERLVAGAEMFAAGDREHRIQVQIPPELVRVAAEFNRMIGRIHESEHALDELAHRDALTLLHNRRAFEDQLHAATARLARFGEPFGLVAFDLDHFKQINDTHGHSDGDAVLRNTARLLAAGVRPFDGIFRTGGEEFAAILPNAEHAGAGALARRLCETIATSPTVADHETIPVTVSVGVAFARTVEDAATLLERADVALYRAKAAGRNQVVIEEEAVTGG
jgi:diguanylate cyclase (GGDEF)-like protein